VASEQLSGGRTVDGPVLDKIKEETHGEILGDLEIVRIPLDLCRARNATNRQFAHGRAE
jgi:hypothetical protein